MEIDYQEFAVLEGDTLLLCTDGLTNYVEEQDILKQSAQPLELCCDTLIELAKQNGGGDNITITAVQY